VDIERTIQFILEQQAQISAQFSNHHARFEHDMVQINAVLLDVATTQERTNQILATLAERQIATEEAVSRLADRQNTTEQTLNTLISTVERHIANHK
jgi:ABC-type transporter Mla subunit MlaD